MSPLVKYLHPLYTYENVVSNYPTETRQNLYVPSVIQSLFLFFVVSLQHSMHRAVLIGLLNCKECWVVIQIWSISGFYLSRVYQHLWLQCFIFVGICFYDKDIKVSAGMVSYVHHSVTLEA